MVFLSHQKTKGENEYEDEKSDKSVFGGCMVAGLTACGGGSGKEAHRAAVRKKKRTAGRRPLPSVSGMTVRVRTAHSGNGSRTDTIPGIKKIQWI